MKRRRIETLGDEPTIEERQRRAADRAKARAYLERYLGAQRRVGQLRARRRQILIELREPGAGVARYQLAPARGVPGDPTAAPTIRLDEIERQLTEQLVEAEAAVERIMLVLSVLPPYSRERQALELRYVDRASLEKAMHELYASRRQFFRLVNAGLDQLMENEDARTIIEKEAEG